MHPFVLAGSAAAFALLGSLAAREALADPGSHGAFYLVEPGVYPRTVACTTEPPPAAPIVKVRPSPHGRLRLRVTGIGGMCHARWTATRSGPRSTDIAIAPGYEADLPSACGTCVVDLLVTRLGRGDYRVTIAGTTIAPHAP